MSYMSEESIKEQNNIELNIKDLEVIFDVLNVYDPNDIKDVYPEMGEEKFLRDVTIAWRKILDIISEKAYNYHFDDVQIQPIDGHENHTWGARCRVADDDASEGNLKEFGVIPYKKS